MQRHLVNRRHQIILTVMMNQLIWIEISYEKHGIETVPVPDERDETTEKQNRKLPSRIEDAISDNSSRLVGNLDGKRRSKTN